MSSDNNAAEFMMEDIDFIVHGLVVTDIKRADNNSGKEMDTEGKLENSQKESEDGEGDVDEDRLLDDNN